jgi:hypothetical protein
MDGTRLSPKRGGRIEALAQQRIIRAGVTCSFVQAVAAPASAFWELAPSARDFTCEAKFLPQNLGLSR